MSMSKNLKKEHPVSQIAEQFEKIDIFFGLGATWLQEIIHLFGI